MKKEPNGNYYKNQIGTSQYDNKTSKRGTLKGKAWSEIYTTDVNKSDILET